MNKDPADLNVTDTEPVQGSTIQSSINSRHCKIMSTYLFYRSTFQSHFVEQDSIEWALYHDQGQL
jgi:hypothetical protein